MGRFAKKWVRVRQISNITSSRNDFASALPALIDKSSGVHLLDLTAALKKALHAGQKIYYDKDSHPTAIGHSVIAEALLGYLRQIKPQLFSSRS